MQCMEWNEWEEYIKKKEKEESEKKRIEKEEWKKSMKSEDKKFLNLRYFLKKNKEKRERRRRETLSETLSAKDLKKQKNMICRVLITFVIVGGIIALSVFLYTLPIP